MKFTNGTRSAVLILVLVAISIALVALLTVRVTPAQVQPFAGPCNRGHPCASPTATPTLAPTPSPTPVSGCLNPGANVQAAIDAATAGSTICLNPGMYAGFIVTKALTITGGHVRDTTRTYPILVTASGVTLDRIEVSGAPTQYGAGVRFDGVSGGAIRNCNVHNNLSYDIDINNSTNVTVADCVLTFSGAGVWVYGSTGFDIARNDIHDINVETRNDTAPDNDYGGQCVSLNNFAGPGLVRDNKLHGCRANSIDYGTDGTGVEVWQAYGFNVSGNTIYDTINAFETGTHGPEGAFTFEYNVVYGTTGPLGILRSNPGTKIQHNTFDGNADGLILQHHSSSQFSGSVENVVIRSNLFTNNPNKALRFDTPMPASLSINYNGYWNNGRIEWDWGTFSQWQAGTPYDDNGLSADPLYVNRLARDYRLQAGSPMIGRAHDGTNIGAQ